MIGKTLSHYKVLEKIGQGGMGEVYRAEDTNLDREVAIKVLPEQFTQDPQRLARFEREAKLLASLNHPNIAAIYGFEEADDVRFLAMELVPGDTLQERVAKGPVPVEETLEICRQIAEGVEAAHEKGVIHRDLKPANVKVTPEGKVKILDFGLAKAFEEDTPVTDISQSPTLTEEMTRAGVILGTAAYMSPEQAKGKPVDKRADVFAFGAVLYELLTGKRAFEGETITETIAAVLKSEPDWKLLPVATPFRIRELLLRCLRKEIHRRQHHMGDVRIDIEDTLADPSTPSPEIGIRTQPRWQRVAPWAVAAVVTVAAGILLWTDHPAPSSSLLTRLVVSLPSQRTLPQVKPVNPIAISPDGRSLVYVARRNDGGTTQLFRRRIDEFDSKAMEGTEDAQAPFFSPDGQWIGFFRNDAIYKVSVSGGQPVKICATAVFFPSASWGTDDTIIFSDGTFRLMRVSVNGGEPQQLTAPDVANGEWRHFAPQFLPGGRYVLFTIQTDEELRAALLSLESNEWDTVLHNAGSARYVSTGHLVYAQEGALLAVEFDTAQVETRGSPIPMGEQVSNVAHLGVAHFAVSSTGTLLYASDSEMGYNTLVWVDRAGQTTPLTTDPAPHSNPRISPDGRQIAVTVAGDIWIYDVETGNRRPLTTAGYNLESVWNPDTESLTFSSVTTDSGSYFDLYSLPADRRSEPELLLTREGRQFPTSWSSDGELLGFYEWTPSGWDIGVLRGGNPSPVLTEESYNEHSPMFSTDGRWLAYVSDESGQAEIYVMRYPGTGGSQLISSDGGTQPMWSSDGRELFYRNGDLFMRVPVESTDRDFPFGTPEVLFEGRYASGSAEDGGINYDVEPGAEHFLMLQLSPDAEPSKLHVVLNWTEELKRLVPTN